MVMTHQIIKLKKRRVINFSGNDARHFLHNLITTDVENLKEKELLPGALLSPQGKVLFDFLIAKDNKRYFIDIDETLVDSFIKRLTLYKLRSDVQIDESKEDFIGVYFQNDSSSSQSESSYLDKRFPDHENIVRIYSRSPLPVSSNFDEWTLKRIQYAISESENDFELGDVFPHDINFDQTGGLCFQKGCYIGQEVVSRMHHRSTARKRTLIAESSRDIPSFATIEAAGKPIGKIGTTLGQKALALVRIDRVKTAIDSQTPLQVNGMTLTLTIAPNMHYDFPKNNLETE
ncbi:YgfZ/GcvT domain-containing protein [Bartonella tamiae]|uniref:Folate-binding protein YgfZ n=1 Tax=Bartonella tamiae Th239 TaxID=1094558 RepID=J0ZPV5_9HYPH|nr:folate-binding protein YgfZ [Bartonella tamiae]EJF90638.1 folate-binding protein YgfZ [Bartonella tamiae Th239]EJF93985.1 folate-binding protein YgfZ [Bartonella tamiae Th307]